MAQALSEQKNVLASSWLQEAPLRESFGAAGNSWLKTTTHGSYVSFYMN